VFTENDIEAAKVCLSSVLGGMGHFRGRPSIGIAADVELDSNNRALSEARLRELVKSVNDKSSIVSLFTSTPSRTSFPRGFLWDEGFHQMLVSQWSPTLSLEVISSWLQAMHSPCEEAGKAGDQACLGGWIPREMILGEEAKRRVPDEFVVQRVNIANPPTFLLVVDSLLDRFASAIPPRRFAATARKQQLIDEPKRSDLSPASEELKPDEKHGDREVMRRYRKEVDPRDAQLVLLEHTADRDVVLSFLRDIYPLLHRWVQWYLHSQKGSDAQPGSFRWRGRSQTDGKVIPNTLASGLDDYPRAPVASAEEHHVDLHCWMTKATAVMARLESVLRDTEYALPPASEALALMAQYQSQHEYLLQRLDELHWSAEHHGFFDVGVNNEDGYFSQELVFRCSNPQDQSTRDVLVPMEAVRQRKQDFCPPSHPKPLFPLGDGQGKYKIVERLVMQDATLSHIPRVGYVAIFPLLMKLLDPYSPKLGAVLDMLEDPQKLWTDHGLRSIGLTDKFYQRRNSEGDAPYWR
jgi:mannosyl-oligosaccharide glucosidase